MTHVDVSRACFHAKAQRTVLVKLGRRPLGKGRWESRTAEEERTATGMQQAIENEIGEGIS